MENLVIKIDKLNEDFTKLSEDVGGLVIGLTREIQRLNSEVIDLRNEVKKMGVC